MNSIVNEAEYDRRETASIVFRFFVCKSSIHL